jgi:8-oxo-dGTP diphosphatase
MQTVVVVGAAIVRAGRVLAARRVRPSSLAGGWEFPGGKVEEGESDAAALIRECREELGIGIEVGPRLGVAAIDPGRELRIYLASLYGPEPQAGADHDRLRWLGANELDGVLWLAVDRPLVQLLRPILAAEG